VLLGALEKDDQQYAFTQEFIDSSHKLRIDGNPIPVIEVKGSTLKGTRI
jgi:hypothetical protein